MSEYQAPELRVPEELYEKPMLLDLEEVVMCKVCDTGGVGAGT